MNDIGERLDALARHLRVSKALSHHEHSVQEAKAEIERLRDDLERIRQVWQRECKKPSGRMEDRRVFYEVFAGSEKRDSDAG